MKNEAADGQPIFIVNQVSPDAALIRATKQIVWKLTASYAVVGCVFAALIFGGMIFGTGRKFAVDELLNHYSAVAILGAGTGGAMFSRVLAPAYARAGLSFSLFLGICNAAVSVLAGSMTCLLFPAIALGWLDGHSVQKAIQSFVFWLGHVYIFGAIPMVLLGVVCGAHIRSYLELMREKEAAQV